MKTECRLFYGALLYRVLSTCSHAWPTKTLDTLTGSHTCQWYVTFKLFSFSYLKVKQRENRYFLILYEAYGECFCLKFEVFEWICCVVSSVYRLCVFFSAVQHCIFIVFSPIYLCPAVETPELLSLFECCRSSPASCAVLICLWGQSMSTIPAVATAMKPTLWQFGLWLCWLVDLNEWMRLMTWWQVACGVKIDKEDINTRGVFGRRLSQGNRGCW